MLNQMMNILLPKKSLQRRLVKRILIKLRLKNPHAADYYALWKDQQNLYIPLNELVGELAYRPLVSVVVPVYNPKKQHITELIYSILNQSYTNWELILCDASPDASISDYIEGLSRGNSRIRHLKNHTKGISANTNYALKHVKGEYIAFCDHDDTLEPFALEEVVREINLSGAEVVYTDEDKVSDDSEIFFDAHFKPDWSPDLFTHVNYMNHLSVVKKTLIDQVGELDSEKDGAQDYDFMLRIVDLHPVIKHVSKVLYHWRATENSTAQNFDSKTNITDAASLALEQHFKRNKLTVQATPIADRPGFYNLSFSKPKEITIVIMPFASNAVVNLYVTILSRMIKRVDSKVAVTLITPYEYKGRVNQEIKTITIPASSDYIAKALEKTITDQVIIISEPYLPESNDWFAVLPSLLEQKHVGAVSPIVLQDDGTVEDAGLVYDARSSLIQLFKGQPAHNNQTLFGNTSWVRNVDGLSGGVIAVRTNELAEFIKQLNHAPTNILTKFTLQLRMSELYNVIYTPVRFGSNSLELPKRSTPESRISFFNPNLLYAGQQGYILYSAESNIISMLVRIAEREGINI